MNVMDLVASCIFLCRGTSSGISPWHSVVKTPAPTFWEGCTVNPYLYSSELSLWELGMV